MLSSTKQLMSCFEDPIKEIETIREYINPELIENFLSDQSRVVKDILITGPVEKTSKVFVIYS
ncbi:hypothetical protein [Legionella drancourtii]|uniref:Uncharacterized protein n=1 Tax=Legionella drancourtii LLAP12 TaxID=658187 RepID=G9EKN4_9GAMM|nr:hypothetical protein [Legionella drancourtii]EHL32167.1 hypothetical protein LDG_5771 [Legionella drancourtii LLAP12]